LSEAPNGVCRTSKPIGRFGPGFLWIAESDRLISMIRIRFTDLDSKKRALGRLAGRYPFKSWTTGEMLVPEAALGYLATESISFQVEGPATYEQNTPAIRDPAPTSVQ
jgi:hypothetical protein